MVRAIPDRRTHAGTYINCSADMILKYPTVMLYRLPVFDLRYKLLTLFIVNLNNGCSL